MPESLIIDATYKLNAHKLVFVDIVGTSNVMSKKHGTLATFEIAGAWIREEHTYCYEWVLTCLQDTIWPTSLEAKIRLPSVIVTENEKALRSAITTVFPTSRNLLCCIHLERNFVINLMNEVAETDKDKKELIKLDILAMFKNIAFSANNKRKAHNEDEDAVCQLGVIHMSINGINSRYRP